MQTFLANNLEDTKKIATDFITSLNNHKGERACIVGLSGDLGSGKTTFVQLIAKNLGVMESVTSPTFVIQKTYQIKHPFFKKLVHIDAYRLESTEELIKLNFNETSSDSRNLIFIEWPENVIGIISTNSKIIKFSVIDDERRSISL